MNTDNMAKETRTTAVEPISSFFVGHETFNISIFTSLKKKFIFFAIFYVALVSLARFYLHFNTGRSGRNRTRSNGFGDRWFTINRRSCLQGYFISLCGVCFLQNLQNFLSSSLSGFFFLFFVEE